MPPIPPSEQAFPPQAALTRTGVPQLDVVLGGGLHRGALVMLLGPPGSGKTTLACQIAFAAAARGERALIWTAFSEPTLKLVEHLRDFRFFQPDLLGTEVQLLNVQQLLAEGLEAAEREIVAAARQFEARWVVLDGFQALRTLAPDERALRLLLYRLGTRLSVEGTTTLMTTEAEPRDPQLFPELTTSDVLVGLYFDLQGVRAVRGLEVIKARGNAPLPGRHSLLLTAEGVTIFPRLETRIRLSTTGAPLGVAPARLEGLPARADFGLADLDALLSGGLTRQMSTVLAGSLGAGKTVLALSFALAGISHGEPAVWLSFREPEEQLLAQAEAFGLGERLRSALAEGRLWVRHWDPVEVNPDQVASDLLATIEQSGARRLVIDSLAELARVVRESALPRRVPNYLAALLAALRARGVTLLALQETAQTVSTELDCTTDELSVLAENVLLVEHTRREGAFQRRFWVLKMRFSSHPSQPYELVLTAPDGIRLFPLEAPTARGRTRRTNEQTKPGRRPQAASQGEAPGE